MNKTAFALIVCAAPLLAGCAELPGAAPTAREVGAPSGADAANNFVTLDLDDRVVALFKGEGYGSLTSAFKNSRPASDIRIGAGDVLQISLWENGAAGVFTQISGPTVTGGRSAQLQPVQVGRNGEISVPYVGTLNAAGKTASGLTAAIVEKLASLSVGAQASVFVQQPAAANSVAVGGEVNHASVIPLSLKGDRLLDVIEEAGGAKYPTYETIVRLTRGGRTATISLEDLVKTPQENIFVAPRDDVYLIRRPRSFSVVGASGHVGQYTFDQAQLNFAEAISKSGGLVDMVADPGGLFLFRLVPAHLINEIAPGSTPESRSLVPLALRVNLRDGDGYVRAQQFFIHDKDLILVANAEGTQWIKALAVIRGVSGVVGDVTGKSTKP